MSNYIARFAREHFVIQLTSKVKGDGIFYCRNFETRNVLYVLRKDIKFMLGPLTVLPAFRILF